MNEAKQLPVKNITEENIHEIEAKIRVMEGRVGAMTSEDLSAYLYERAKQPT